MYESLWDKTAEESRMKCIFSHLVSEGPGVFQASANFSGLLQ
jgi:hypothetical protein